MFAMSRQDIGNFVIVKFLYGLLLVLDQQYQYRQF